MPTPSRARRQFLLGAVTVVIIIVGVALIVAALVPGSDGAGLGGIFAHTTTTSDPTTPRVVVTGYGQAGAPADSASLQLLVQNTVGGYGNSGQDYGTPGPGAAGTVQMAAANPMVDALVAAGVPQDNIDVVVSPSFGGSCYGPGCPSPFRLDITVSQPSLDRVTKLINVAAQAANDNNLRITDVGAAYTLSDCSTLQQQARQAAIADGQQQAQEQAQLLHAQLGSLMEVSDLPSATNDGSGSCSGPLQTPSSPSTRSSSTSALSVPEFDPKAPTNAVAQVKINLTYTIQSTPTAS